jgi:pimeloyl-ACP methyl ester carboxylesterase
MERILQSSGRVLRYYEYPTQIGSNIREAVNYLICCPGWLCCPITMGDMMKEVTEQTNFSLISMEWRGHGKSTISFLSLVTVADLADDLNDLVRYFRTNSPNSRIALLGHSMGANVIWRYINKFGECDIDRYIFVDQPAAITGSKIGEMLGYRKEWRIHSKAEVYFLSLLCFFKNYLIPILERAISLPHWMSGRFLSYTKECNGLACARLLIDTTFADNTQRIQLVTRPCLVYGGESSFVNTDVARWIAQQVRGPVQLLIYPKPYGTHFPFYATEDDREQIGPKLFTKDLSEYLFSTRVNEEKFEVLE